ncbi:hypothetical protein L1887_42397 [Cichorium endivia]|nr:hypothetical protein L1887_42397 [Cichorium endivia]
MYVSYFVNIFCCASGCSVWYVKMICCAFGCSLAFIENIGQLQFVIKGRLFPLFVSLDQERSYVPRLLQTAMND